MPARVAVRAVVLATAAAIALGGVAAADTAPGDADLVTPGVQASRSLGTVAPGTVLQVTVGFVLTCKGLSHVDPGQVVTFTASTIGVPAGGAASATDATLGPVPPTWPADDAGCPAPAPTLETGVPSRVTLTAPTTPGDYTFTLVYARSVTPPGLGDGSSLTSLSAVDLVVTVEAVAPPPAPDPDPTPTPAPPAAEPPVHVDFGAPLGRGVLRVPRWVRVLPVAFRLSPGAVAPSLAVVPLAGCSAASSAGAAGPERGVPIRPAGRRGWLGLANLRGLGSACARVEVRVGPTTVGSAIVALRP